MKNKSRFFLPPSFSRDIIALLVATMIVQNGASAKDAALPFVSPVFGDKMVLQRNKADIIWGWTKPGEKVRVSLGDKTADGIARPDGSWSVSIQPPAAGGPYQLVIDGPEHVVFQDVLVGDVWLCSGQSNMELGMSRVSNSTAEIKMADHPEIRLFKVDHQIGYTPKKTLQGSWKICTPQTLAPDSLNEFSAVAYYFGRSLQKELQVPIGLVEDCVGGTAAEVWISTEALHPLKDFDTVIDKVAALQSQGAPEHGNFMSHWYDEYDAGQKENAWFAPGLDDHDWKSVSLPQGFRELGLPETPALCYFRKTITLPDPLPPGAAQIKLGVIERMDTTIINGKEVGASAWVENPRVYTIGKDILKPGPNQITLRVLKTKADGGFKSPPEQLKLVLGDNTEIPLAEGWKGKVSVDARSPHPMPFSYDNWPIMPSVLYNGMIAPLIPLSITGVIWYQGESNTDRAEQYRKLLPALITNWRKDFHQGDFPFYIVGLSAYMQHNDDPGANEGWAKLREVQDSTSQQMTNSGLVTTIDIGDANNVHPMDKKDVGERLALLALAQHYGKKIPFSGPRFLSAEPLPGAVKLHFTHTDRGLMVKGDQLAEFSLAGEDHVWHWADAKIEGDSVVVSSAKVPHPVSVRYAWQSNPKATLFNGVGLPAVPFQTDIH